MYTKDFFKERLSMEGFVYTKLNEVVKILSDQLYVSRYYTSYSNAVHFS